MLAHTTPPPGYLSFIACDLDEIPTAKLTQELLVEKFLRKICTTNRGWQRSHFCLLCEALARTMSPI